MIVTTNYPVYLVQSLTVPQWIVSGHQIDPRATGAVYDWFQSWTNDLFKTAAEAGGDLNTVMSKMSAYTLDGALGVPGITGFPDELWGQQAYKAKFNAFFPYLRTNGDGGTVCGQVRPGFLANTLYHEARHTYQSYLTSVAGNDEDQDFLVNAIPIAPSTIFIDTVAGRTVCDSSAFPGIPHFNWMFLGPGHFDAMDASLITLLPTGGVSWAKEMDAYMFAAAPPR